MFLHFYRYFIRTVTRPNSGGWIVNLPTRLKSNPPLACWRVLFPGLVVKYCEELPWNKIYVQLSFYLKNRLYNILLINFGNIMLQYVIKTKRNIPVELRCTALRDVTHEIRNNLVFAFHAVYRSLVGLLFFLTYWNLND